MKMATFNTILNISRSLALLPNTSIPALTTQIHNSPTHNMGAIMGVDVKATVLEPPCLWECMDTPGTVVGLP